MKEDREIKQDLSENAPFCTAVSSIWTCSFVTHRSKILTAATLLVFDPSAHPQGQPLNLPLTSKFVGVKHTQQECLFCVRGCVFLRDRLADKWSCWQL